LKLLSIFIVREYSWLLGLEEIALPAGGNCEASRFSVVFPIGEQAIKTRPTSNSVTNIHAFVPALGILSFSSK
jgi:hypothetical protein